MLAIARCSVRDRKRQAIAIVDFAGIIGAFTEFDSARFVLRAARGFERVRGN